VAGISLALPVLFSIHNKTVMPSVGVALGMEALRLSNLAWRAAVSLSLPLSHPRRGVRAWVIESRWDPWRGDVSTVVGGRSAAMAVGSRS
jgi:hypothetical protein